MRIVVGSCFLSLALAACGLDVTGQGGAPTMQGDDPASGGDAAAPRVDAGAQDDAGAVPVEEDAAVDAGAPEPPDPRDALVGQFAGRRTFATIQTIDSTLFSQDVRVLTSSYTLADVERRGTEYVMRERACRIRVDTSGDFFTQIDVSIDDRVARSMAPTESVLVATSQGGRIAFERPLASAALGFLPNGPGDVMPASPGDPRVRDTEGDGHPGVTVHITARVGLTVDGDAYIVQWNRARYVGELDGANDLRGENDERTVQRVIDTSEGDDVLGNAISAVRDDEDRTQNLVELVRLDAPLDCDAMLAREASLFSPLPTP